MRSAISLIYCLGWSQQAADTGKSEIHFLCPHTYEGMFMRDEGILSKLQLIQPQPFVSHKDTEQP